MDVVVAKDDIKSPESDPICFGCGREHGAVSAERNCMRLALVELRMRLKETERKLRLWGEKK